MDQAITRYSFVAFVAFSALVILAFWPSYFSRIFIESDLHIHAHAVPFTLWCMLLIAEAGLIRARREVVHKLLGLVSYVLVPILAYGTVRLIHARLSGVELTPAHFVVFAATFNALIVFLILFGLAVYHRSDPSTHARYMVATTFPLFTAFTDRLVTSYPALVDFVMKVVGTAPVPISQVGFALADVTCGAMFVWDWHANRRRDVFAVVLVLLLMVHVSVFVLHEFPWWRSFATWFARLPL
jgi:hypothetical protein